ncbi:hypothetical protein CN934_18360 [Ensifer sp. MMN_5]|nr:hypothetical protein CN934_18360 [Ensifer sp. MMN_5]
MAQLTAGMKQRKHWRYLHGLETRWRHREALGMPRMRITLQAPPAPRHFLQQVSVQDGIWPEQAQRDADPSSID